VQRAIVWPRPAHGSACAELQAIGPEGAVRELTGWFWTRIFAAQLSWMSHIVAGSAGRGGGGRLAFGDGRFPTWFGARGVAGENEPHITDVTNCPSRTLLRSGPIAVARGNVRVANVPRTACCRRS